MTGGQENKLSMYLTIRDYNVPYTAITSTIPNFVVNNTSFISLIPQIQSLSQQQKADTTNLSASKMQYRNNLSVQVADYARKLNALAKFTNNLALLADTKITESKLKHMADTAVRDYAQLMYDRAQSNLTTLPQYGIITATQNNLAALISGYNTILSKPTVGKIESTKITKQIAAAFKSADGYLANMDAGVEIVRLTQPDFYFGYKKARKVGTTHSRSFTAHVAVLDKKTGEGISAAMVSFIDAGGVVQLSKKTAEKGSINVKSMTTGVYTIKAEKVGYTTQTVTVNITDGEFTQISVALEK